MTPAQGPLQTEQPVPLVLRLLDHQVTGAQKEMLGNVDDLVLREGHGRLVVTGFMTGPPALARRQGGRAGAWLYAGWRRLHPDAHPRPVVIPLGEVTTLASAVVVSPRAQEVLAESQGLELWLRQHVIGRLPGATGADRRPRGSAAVRHPVPEDWRLEEGALTLSQLLGSVVRQGERTLGRVSEVVADAVAARPGQLGELRVTELVCAPRRLGQELGYTMAPQGPAALGLLLRAWHRHDVRVAFGDLESVDWAGRVVHVAARASTPHPHTPR